MARRRCQGEGDQNDAGLVIERIEADLRQEWSPEQIAGRLAADGGLRLSPPRIYQHIQADRQAGGTLYRHLRHSQKKRKKRYGKADGRGQIKDRVSIDQRPAIVAEKSRIGDWEIDLVLGGQRSGALVSLVERRSRYTVLGKVASKQAEHVAEVTIELLKPHTGHTHTITASKILVGAARFRYLANGLRTQQRIVLCGRANFIAKGGIDERTFRGGESPIRPDADDRLEVVVHTIVKDWTFSEWFFAIVG